MSMWTRVRNVFRGERLNREIYEEMESHLAEAVAEGRDPMEARRAFGSTLRRGEESYSVQVAGWLDSLRADVVFGWRQLKKRKVTTTAAVLSLALGIGACVTAFLLVDALFLRSMPVSDPASLYAVTYKRQATAYLPSSFDTNSYPFFERAREVAKGDAEVAAASTMSHIDVTYGADAETEKAYRQWVSGELFSMLGLKPTLGRLLTEDDDRFATKSPYAVISYDYWTQRFGRDPKVIGRTFRMGDNLYEIVGVGPKKFTGTEPGTRTDIFAPARMEPILPATNQFWLRVFVRGKPGVNATVLAGKLNGAYQRWEEERLKAFPKSVTSGLGPNPTLELKPAGGGVSKLQSDYGEALTVLGVLVGMVLLIACANVANLMAGQAAARARELALRMSLGSGRARLVRMVMVESAMLGTMAASLGLMFAWWATPIVVGRINPSDNPARLVLGADWLVVGFSAGLAMSVTLLFGLLPALQASSVQPVNALKGGAGPGAKTQWMQGMVAVQVAFCFVVLFVAGLFAVTLTKLLHLPMGFVAERLLLLDTVTNTEQPAVKWDQMAAALRQVPGVQSTALENWPLMSGAQQNELISVHGEAPSQTLAFFLAVSPGWLDTMRIPLVDGRDFRDTDATPSVALVNETFVKTFFGGRSPVGQSFELTRHFDAPQSQPNVHYEVIGVVKDVMYWKVRDGILPQVYLPVHQLSAAAGAAVGTLQTRRREVIAVRTLREDVAQMAEVLRRTVTQTDPEFRVSTVTTQTELISDQTIRERLLATLGGFFASVALLLAAIGLYGVLHYSVVQREREIGIRIALGAAAGNIVRLVTTRVFAMVTVGAVAGLVLGMASVRYVATLLYGVKGTDPGMLLGPTAVLLAAAGLASLPAVMRAVRIDPAVMLKAE